MRSLFITLGVGSLMASLYFLVRKRKVQFFNNVMCDTDACINLDTQEKVDDYIKKSKQRTAINTRGLDDAGSLQLLFDKPHGFRVNEEVVVKQNLDAKYKQYDGETVVVRVNNPYVITLNKAGVGDSPGNGGVVIGQSVLNRYC